MKELQHSSGGSLSWFTGLVPQQDALFIAELKERGDTPTPDPVTTGESNVHASTIAICVTTYGPLSVRTTALEERSNSGRPCIRHDNGWRLSLFGRLAGSDDSKLSPYAISSI